MAFGNRISGDLGWPLNSLRSLASLKRLILLPLPPKRWGSRISQHTLLSLCLFSRGSLIPQREFLVLQYRACPLNLGPQACQANVPPLNYTLLLTFFFQTGS